MRLRNVKNKEILDKSPYIFFQAEDGIRDTT